MGATRKKPSQPKKPTLVDDDEKKGASLRPDEMPAEVLEFITAIDEYKRLHRRPFPTWSEVLEVLRALGYRKVEAATALPGVPIQPKVGPS